MIKYYTRACNFYYGKQAQSLIRNKKALPLCGHNQICFDNVEIITRKEKKIFSKFIQLKNIKSLKKAEKKSCQQWSN